MKKGRLYSRIILLLYAIFFAGFIFSFRAVSSISIMALMAAGLIQNKGSFKKVFSKKELTLYLGACTLFYILSIVSFFFHNDTKAWWIDFQLKSGLLFISLAVILTGPFYGTIWRKLINSYCVILFIASIYCLTRNLFLYSDTGDGTVFFYHKLVGPLRQHAVYYSIYVIVAFVLLLDRWQQKQFLFHRLVHIGALVFFSAFLILLSSKTVLVFYIAYLVYYFIARLKKDKRKGVLIISSVVILILTGLIFFTSNPVAERFRDAFSGDPGLAEKGKYDPGVYFNGIQFRLLQWRLVPHILNEHNGWITGAGTGNAQVYLDHEYVSRNMWQGIPGTSNRGYLGHNTHNQFLEALLRYGIPGLIVFLFIYYFLIIISLRSKRVSYRFILLLLLFYACVDAVLERQYGILMLCFFPCFFWQEEKEPGAMSS